MLKKILKIKLKVIGGILLILLLVQLISAYFFGVMAEKQLDIQFKYITDTSLIKVVSRDYNRGWLSSNESVVLSVNNQVLKNVLAVLPGATSQESITAIANGSYQVRYSTRVTHGLFAGWLHGTFAPTIAYSSTKIAFPEKIDKLLSKFFINKQPLEIDNVIYLNKSGKYTIYSPGFNYDEALSGVKINWGGLYLKIAYNPEFNHFKNDLSVPLFEMTAPTKGEFNFNNFEYASNSNYSVNNIKVGTTDLKLANLKVAMIESNSVGLKFGEIVHALVGVNSADFLNGIDAINPANFQIQNVTYNSISKDENNFFSAVAKAGFESLTSNNKKYGPMNFDLDLEHISSPEFSKLLDNLNGAAGEDQTDQNSRDKTVAMLKTYLTPIFIKRPEVTLNGFSLVTPDGVIMLSGHATTINFESSDMLDQASFMKKISADMKFSIPKSVLAYFFVLQMKYFLTAGNAQMDQQSSDALSKVVNILLDNQLHVWLKKGYLMQKESMISSTISLESGVVSLNGIPTK